MATFENGRALVGAAGPIGEWVSDARERTWKLYIEGDDETQERLNDGLWDDCERAVELAQAESGSSSGPRRSKTGTSER